MRSSNIKKRHLKERVFRALGFYALLSTVTILVCLLSYIFWMGVSVLWDTHVFIPTEKDVATISKSEFIYEILANSIAKTNSEKRKIISLVSRGATLDFETDEIIIYGKSIKGVWVIASGLTDSWKKGKYDLSKNQSQRPINDLQIKQLNLWEKQGFIRQQFSKFFFTNPDSRYPELAGLAGAFIGSLLTMMVTITLSFPIGVLTALYLEEWAKPSAFNRFIELNINNLAAVPSIIYGLLGLSLFINGLVLPRSASVVAGMVLSLMVTPVIIISSRAAIQSVSKSLKEAALGLGASHMQAVLHFVLPQSLPGIMTGSLLGLSRALGETAPLLMIGMVSFIGSIPKGINSPATVLPVQIYLWSDSPERSFFERTSGAILMLIFLLIALNLISQIIRFYFEKTRIK